MRPTQRWMRHDNFMFLRNYVNRWMLAPTRSARRLYQTVKLYQSVNYVDRVEPSQARPSQASGHEQLFRVYVAADAAISVTGSCHAQ